MKVRFLVSKEVQAIGMLEDLFSDEKSFPDYLGFLNENVQNFLDFYKRIAKNRKRVYFDIIEGKIEIPFNIINFERYEKELKKFAEEFEKIVEENLEKIEKNIKKVLNVSFPDEVLVGIYYKFKAHYWEGHAICYNDKGLILLGYHYPWNENHNIEVYLSGFVHELLHILFRINKIKLENEEEVVKNITRFVMGNTIFTWKTHSNKP